MPSASGKAISVASASWNARERQRLLGAQQRPRVDGARAVAGRGADDRELPEHAAVRYVTDIAADQDDDADEAGEQPSQPGRR